MAEYGKYIYGIIPCEPADAEKLKSSKCNFVFYKDIAAMVADSEIIDCSVLTRENTARMLVQHQQTIEKIMELGYLIIPMKLGTFVANEREVTKFLANSYSFIKKIIEENIGKIEIDIVALWSDFAAILKEIGEEKDIREFKAELMANPANITKDNQKQIGLMIASSIGKKRYYYANKIHESLSTVSLRNIPHETMDDKMILNTAFLLKKSELEKFENKVETINAEFKDSLHFRYIGPLPCYSFYTFELEYIDVDKVELARNKLKLNKSVELKEIKKAYKTKAMKLHPDKNMGNTDVNNKFDDLVAAYKTLVDYCTATTKEGECCSLKEEDVNNNNLIVKLKE